MPIEFRCPQCGKLLRTPDSSAGKKGKCPHCQSVNDIPLASTAPQEKPIEPVAPTRPAPRVETPSPFGGPSSDPFATLPGPAPLSASDPFATLPSSSPAASPGQTDLFAGLPSSLPSSAGPANPFAAPTGSFGGAPNPFGAPAPAPTNPYSAPTFAASQPSYSYQSSGLQPHRGGIVLALGIIALLSSLGGVVGACCCCLFLPLDVVALAVGIPAAVLGHADLRKMRDGFMDSSGHGMTMTGYVMGIAAVVVVLLSIVLFVVALMFNIGMQGMQQNQGFKF